VGSSRPFTLPLERLSMRCSGGLTRSVSTAIRNRTVSQMEQKSCPAPFRNLSDLPLIRPLSSRVASCVSPICPTTPSIASAGTKQRFGAKPDRSCLHWTPWIAADHTIKGTVTVSAVGKIWSTSTRNDNFRGRRSRDCSARRGSPYRLRATNSCIGCIRRLLESNFDDHAGRRCWQTRVITDAYS
jgi:hypothetical protein